MLSISRGCEGVKYKGDSSKLLVDSCLKAPFFPVPEQVQGCYPKSTENHHHLLDLMSKIEEEANV